MMNKGELMTKSELQNKTVCLVSLGCDKNRVDSERILYKLNKFGFQIINEPSEANILILNTCAFIESARKESIEKILELIDYKRGKAEKIFVVGCLPAKSLNEVKEALPEVDCFLGVHCDDKIIQSLAESYDYKLKEDDNTPDVACSRIVSTPEYTAFLKIADGCNNKCSYCTIPQIRGKYVSVPMEQLLAEANELVANGVKELILVAQDVTRYGEDLYKKHKIVELLQELSKINGLEWIRLHYCYPEFVKDDLIKEIANNPKVCKYMDIPIQHIDNKILHAMNRASTCEGVTALIDKLRKYCPDIAIRTSIIVGFPGETKVEFKKLCEFLKNYQLDNVGFFPYSREYDTIAYGLHKQVPNVRKKHRLKKLVKLQSSIMYSKAILQIGNTLKAICEDFDGENYTFRSQYNSPEIDSVIFVNKNDVKDCIHLGEFYNVKITNVVKPFDLKGEII